MKRIVYSNEIPEVVDIIFCDSDYRDEISYDIFAASSRTKTQNMVRVKSSNVWSMKYDPHDNRTGDVYVQFKGANGGPDDVYVYYDVPAKIYNRLVAAPSKGHMVWLLLRNSYKYAKLTGDKRTHLPNGINYTPTSRSRKNR